MKECDYRKNEMLKYTFHIIIKKNARMNESTATIGHSINPNCIGELTLLEYYFMILGPKIALFYSYSKAAFLKVLFPTHIITLMSWNFLAFKKNIFKVFQYEWWIKKV